MLVCLVYIATRVARASNLDFVKLLVASLGGRVRSRYVAVSRARSIGNITRDSDAAIDARSIRVALGISLKTASDQESP